LSEFVNLKRKRGAPRFLKKPSEWGAASADWSISTSYTQFAATGRFFSKWKILVNQASYEITENKNLKKIY